MTFWGWQLTTASPAYLAATIIQALLVLNYPLSYTFHRWHGSLIYWIITLLGVVVNVGFAKFLPRLEGFLYVLKPLNFSNSTDGVRFIWHIVGFFAILIPLVYLGPQNTASFVFTSTADAEAWPNYGIAWCIGLTTSTFPFVGESSLVLSIWSITDGLTFHRIRRSMPCESHSVPCCAGLSTGEHR